MVSVLFFEKMSIHAILTNALHKIVGSFLSYLLTIVRGQTIIEENDRRCYDE